MTINCPACQGEIEITDEFLGEALACPHCEHLFQLTKKGKVTNYVAPTAGGASKKTLIIGISVAVVAVAGFVALLMSGGEEPTPTMAKPSTPAAASEPPQVSPPPDTGNPDDNVAAFLGMDGVAPPPANSDPMNIPVTPPLEPKPPVDIPATPDGTVLAVAQALADGNPRGFWDAMPPSYQTDVNNLVRKSTELSDPEVWAKGTALMSRMVGILQERQEFIFNTPMLAAVPNKEKAIEGWDAIVGLLDTLVNSDLSDREKMLHFDGGELLGTTGAQILDQVKVVAQLAPGDDFGKMMDQLQGLTAAVTNASAGVADVQINVPNVTNHVEKFVQVESRWIPETLAKDWTNQIATAMASLAKQQQQQQITMQTMAMIGMIDGVLAQIEGAKSQQDFDQVVQGVFGMLMGMQGQGGPGGMPGGPGMSGGQPPPSMNSNMQGAPPGTRTSEWHAPARRFTSAE
jgi:hypothetical protein